MGMLANLFNRNATTTANVPVDPYSTPAAPGATWQDRLATGSNAVVDRATQVYKQNPKLVGGLALLAGAALVAGMKRRGRT